jgi:hypothetical protein
LEKFNETGQNKHEQIMTIEQIGIKLETKQQTKNVDEFLQTNIQVTNRIDSYIMLDYFSTTQIKFINITNRIEYLSK